MHLHEWIYRNEWKCKDGFGKLGKTKADATFGNVSMILDRVRWVLVCPVDFMGPGWGNDEENQLLF